MKTIQFNSFVKGVAIILSLSVFSSCNGTHKEASDTSATSNKAPQVDIQTAVITNDIAAVKQHIKAGSDINQPDPYGGSSPLISAATFGKTEIAKLLIDAGADLNVKNNDGSTALHSAAFFCRPEIVKMLIENGADKSIINNYGATPYQSVIAPFADAKPAYDMILSMLQPMGLQLDYGYVAKTRPVIAEMLK